MLFAGVLLGFILGIVTAGTGYWLHQRRHCDSTLASWRNIIDLDGEDEVIDEAIQRARAKVREEAAANPVLAQMYQDRHTDPRYADLSRTG